MRNQFVLLILFNLYFIVQIHGAIDDLDAVNKEGQVTFSVLDENRVKVPNHYRGKNAALKFSLHGVTIDKFEENSTVGWNLILSDRSLANVMINDHRHINVTEYSFSWYGGGGPNVKRQVCFHYAFHHAFWYNAYQSLNASWPMDKEKITPKQQFNYLFGFNRFWSNENQTEATLVLEHFYVNSDGFAVLLDSHCPWFVERIPNIDDPLLCFSVNNSAKPFMTSNHDPSYLDIKFSIFSSDNIRKVTDFVVHQSGLLPKPTKVPDVRMFSYSIWLLFEIAISTYGTVSAFASDIIKQGFSPNSTILLSAWPSSEIETILKLDAYPEEKLISEFHSKGFKVGVQFHSPTLKQHESIKQYCIKSTDFIDFTNLDSCKYYQSKLSYLYYEKQIDFYLFDGNVYLDNFEFNNTFVQKCPSLLTSKYIETVSQVGNTIISEYAFKSQHLPIWVRTSANVKTPYKQLLRELIPNVLAASIAGYSFIVPYSVGGFDYDNMPSKEMFIRMMQAVTLMPSISFAKRPWDYSDIKLLDIVKRCLILHSEHVPTMVELGSKRIEDGSPIIRPMWYVEPDDSGTFQIGDQFMLGDDILVAPIIHEGHRERNVYFPKSQWIDQHGKIYSGPGQFKVAAPLEELPYFKRKF